MKVNKNKKKVFIKMTIKLSINKANKKSMIQPNFELLKKKL